MKTNLFESLSVEDQELCRLSLKARNKSYSPYSKFAVGASIRCISTTQSLENCSVNGKVFCGSNVENASYGLAICAERTACVKAVSEGHKDFSVIAIAADLDQEYVTPCGACRQFLCEFQPNLKILLIRPRNTTTICVTSLDELLPQSFNPQQFKTHQNNTNQIK